MKFPSTSSQSNPLTTPSVTTTIAAADQVILPKMYSSLYCKPSLIFKGKAGPYWGSLLG